MSVEVTYSGPVFDGTAARVIGDAADEAEREIAQRGYDMVRRELSSVLRDPTGYYESRVAVDLTGEELRIDDGGVVYGPWLEGVGSRNQSSRFKGYATFRRVAQKLEADALSIADEIVAKSVEKVN